jgi:hypothetical protein
VGEGGGVDQDESGSVVARGLHAVHQHMLGVGLQALHRVPGGRCLAARAWSMSASVVWP